jgi:ABC-type transporter Mla subunit MlaD
MISKVVTDADDEATFQSHQAEPRNLDAVSSDLQRRLDNASRTLETLKTQQTTCNSLLHEMQRDLDAALTLGREMKEMVEHKAEEPSGVVATLQAAVEKTKDTVIGRVEHVREQAVAAFHRMKGDGSGVENGCQEDQFSTKDSDRRDAG